MKKNYFFSLTNNLRFGVLLSALILSSKLSSQTTYTFTSAGLTGPTGPTQSQINTAYASTNLSGSVTVTSGIQTFTIPISGPYKITAIGGQGGYNGGYGASMTGEFTLTAGTVLKILVGQAGTQASNGTYIAGGGGGGSYVSTTGNVPYIVAGGGGGNGDGYTGSPVSCCLSGMQGTTSTSGVPYPGGSNGGTSGNGGTCPNTNGGGGAGFYGNGSACGALSAALSFTNGGAGGLCGYVASTSGDGGFGGGGGGYNTGTGQRGGGGGGYSGGGGGSATSGVEPNAPAGGGGSYNSGSNQVNTVASSGGSGRVILQLLSISGGGGPITGTGVVTQTFSYTGALQTFTIPSCTSSMTVDVIGAAGATGGNGGYQGGYGGAVRGILTPTPGAVLNLYIGGTNGYNGGGTGGTGSSGYTGGGGGGATDIRLGGTALANRIIVAGGGGGGGAASGYNATGGNGGSGTFCSSPYGYGGGGASGCDVGLAGSCSGGTAPNYGTGGGGGGTGSGASLAGSNTGGYGQAGSLGLGGNGGGNSGAYGGGGGGINGAGGGGGGYYGGAGGMSGTGGCNGGGGGGSSYINTALFTSSSFTGGTQSGNGLIVVTYNTLGNSISAAASSYTSCSGSSVNLTASGVSTYTWSTSSNSTSIVVNPTTTTSYTVFGTNSSGCVSGYSLSIGVNPLPTVSVNSGTLCGGASFTITPSGAASYSYSSGTNVVSPITNTTYIVTGSSSAGCVSSPAVSSITVSAIPVIAVNSGSICLGKSFVMMPVGAVSYTYTGGSATVSPTTNTNYSVTGMSALGCLSSPVISSVTVLSLPVISVNSGSICAGQNFTILPTGASTYTYAGGSNVVSPTTSTSYTVSGTSTAGCVSAAPATSTVQVAAQPVITVNSGSICSGGTFVLNPSGAVSYTYSGGSASVSPLFNTSYSVTGTNASGCVSGIPAVATVSVYALPTVTISGPASLCLGTTSILNAGGSPATYQWNTSATTSTISVSPTSASSYTVVATGITGCQKTATTSIAILPLPTVGGSVSNSVVCFGQPVLMNGSGAVSYQWSGGVINNISFTPSVTSNYTVTGFDLNNCSNTAVVSVTVNTLPPVTASASNTVICAGASVSLTGAGANTYSWSGGVVNNSIFFPNTTAVYTLTGTGPNGCKNTATVTVVVNPLPNLVVVSTNSVICPEMTVTLTASGANIYNWSTGAALPSIVITPTVTTSYTVAGIAPGGCSISVVFVEEVMDCTILAERDPNGRFSIYPNPSSGELYIATASFSENLNVEVYNATGALIYCKSLDEEVLKLDIYSFDSGMYFVKIKENGHLLKQQRIVKE